MPVPRWYENNWVKNERSSRLNLGGKCQRTQTRRFSSRGEYFVLVSVTLRHSKVAQRCAVVFGVAILTKCLGVVRLLRSLLDLKIGSFALRKKRRPLSVSKNKKISRSKIEIVRGKLEDFGLRTFDWSWRTGFLYRESIPRKRHLRKNYSYSRKRRVNLCLLANYVLILWTNHGEHQRTDRQSSGDQAAVWMSFVSEDLQELQWNRISFACFQTRWHGSCGSNANIFEKRKGPWKKER